MSAHLLPMGRFLAQPLPLARRRSRGGYSLVEVLVSMAVLLIGLLALLNVFPQALKANATASIRAQASLLAQRKAEELRRDRTRFLPFIADVRGLTVPTDPVTFGEDSRLAYQFAGVSLLDPTDDASDPRDDIGVARVIVRYAASYRPTQDVIYELRFAE